MSWKVSRIKFVNHPVLGDLALDFSTPYGVADTIILAGENGTGKSTVLDCIYKAVSGTGAVECEITICKPGQSRVLEFKQEQNYTVVSDGSGRNYASGGDSFKRKYSLNGIYSDVGINFSADNVSAVTSKTLDSSTTSIRSTSSLPREIKQLIVDIQALDDHDVSEAYRKAKSESTDTNDLVVNERMPRFTKAFSRVFDGLMYSTVINSNGHKEILFEKFGKKIPIDSLSSGEKQIIYRGAFLLKDANALSGATVFIDEPEISLHPIWQMRVMDFYKGIFTNEEGIQTSQIFAVTHSPFVIHNDNRRNDKIIILTRDKDGNIVVMDKLEYYKCDSVEAVEDAFCIKSFSAEQPTVYLEGRTDEKYFRKAVQVYGISVPFRFQWVGHLDDRGQEVNTGEKSIDAAYQFLIGRNLSVRNICLKDCDTNAKTKKKNNVVLLSMPSYENSKGMKKGIENALVLDQIDLAPYYSSKTTKGDYGEEKQIQTFDKMACCDAICALDDSILREVFSNLKTMIDRLVAVYNEE